MFAVQIQDEIGSEVRDPVRGLGVGPATVSARALEHPAGPPFPERHGRRRGCDPRSCSARGSHRSPQTDMASLGVELAAGRKVLATVDGATARGKYVVARNINPVTTPRVPRRRSVPTALRRHLPVRVDRPELVQVAQPGPRPASVTFRGFALLHAYRCRGRLHRLAHRVPAPGSAEPAAREGPLGPVSRTRSRHRHVLHGRPLVQRLPPRLDVRRSSSGRTGCPTT
jgi:hypothetical protein